jgi:hypothetical protein
MIRSLLMALVPAVLPTWVLAQTTWYVDANNTPPGTGTQADPYRSLQYAIAQGTTLSGDTVLVLPGTYFELIDFLGKDLLVQSTAGAAATLLDGGGAGPVVTFASGETSAAVLDGFTVQNGDTLAVTPPENPGGGIHCDGASPTLLNLVVRSNNSLRGGGLKLVNGSAATLTDAVVRDNNLLIPFGLVGSSLGGGLWSSCDSAPVITRVEFIHNLRSRGGGAYGSGTFVECLFDENNGFEGAGLYVPLGCTTEVHLSTIRRGLTCVDGDCGIGGGVYGPAQVFDSVIEDNFAVLAGGGAWGATLTRCTIADNTADNVNSFGGQGGGAAACTLTECTVSGNRVFGENPVFASGRGGGIHGGSATDCRIVGNLAIDGRGGGASSATLLRCEVIDNEATDTSGGGQARGGGLVDCTAERTLVRGNRASRGAGVSNGTTIHCVVYRNLASIENGGIEAGNLIQPGNAVVRNSIVRENDAPQLLETNGTITATYSDVEGGFAGTGNFDLDPLWWDAPGGDFHLRPGSPCIDAGDPTSPPDSDASLADVGIHPYDPTWAPGTQGYCYGNPVECPCGNGGSGLGGCDLPQATGGVALTIEDFAPDGSGGGTAKLVGTGYPPMAGPTVVAIRSNTAESPPVVFGDGLRCIGTIGFVRIGSTTAAGGVSERAIVHGAGAGTFFYQLWFRSTPATFCDPSAAFNLSSGLQVAWP